MTDKEKFQKTFDKLQASPDILTEVLNMKTNQRSKGRFSAIKAAAVLAAICMLGGAGVYAIYEMPYNEVFGNFVRVSDSELADSLMANVSDFRYKVSDDDYAVRLLGAAGDGNNIILRAEIYRKDGTPVKDYFQHFAEDESEPVQMYDTSDFEIPFSAMSVASEIEFNDEGNILISYNLNSEKNMNGRRLRFNGLDFYSLKLIKNLIRDNNVYLRTSSKENVLIDMGTNEPSDLSVEDIIGLRLGWSFSFHFNQSESSSLKKTVTDCSQKFNINAVAYIYQFDSDNVYTNLEKIQRELNCQPLSIEFNSFGGEIVYEYTDDFDYDGYITEKYADLENVSCVEADYDKEINEIYLIMDDGNRIYAREDTSKTELNDGVFTKKASFIYYDNDKQTYEDITNVTGIYVNGVIYNLSSIS